MVQLSLPVPPDTSPSGVPPPSLSDGTRLSWDDLYSDLAPALLAYTRSRGVRDPEDVVHDVFVDVSRCVADFTGDFTSLRSLFFTIAYRRIADAHRRHGRSPEVLVSQPRDTGVASSGALPVEDEVLSGETTSAALRALARLSHREQQVIRMRVFEEASPGEVARRLGLTNVNVRVIQARALRKVRVLLEAEGVSRHPLAAAMVLSSFRRFGGGLPSRGVVGDWIQDLRAAAPHHVDVAAAAHPPTDDGAAQVPFAAIASSAAPVVMRLGVVVSAVAVGVATIAFSNPVGAAPAVAETGPVALSDPLPAGADPADGPSADGPAGSTDRLTAPHSVPGSSGVLPTASDPPLLSFSTDLGIVDPLTGTLIRSLAETDDALVDVTSSLIEEVTDSPVVSATTAALGGVTQTVAGAVDSTVATGGDVVADMARAEAVNQVVDSVTDSTVDESGETAADVDDVADGDADEAVGSVNDLTDEPVEHSEETTDPVTDEVLGLG